MPAVVMAATCLSALGHVTALEKDPAALERARARALAEVYPGCLPDNIPPALGRDFDLLLLDVLEHIADDRGSLARIAGLTHPAGKILITVPACQWLLSEHDERHHHKRRYLQKDLTAVLHDSGLIVSHITCFNSLLFPLAAPARLKQKMTPSQASMALPPPLLNVCLEKIFGLKEKWLGRFPLPYGVSLLAIARKRCHCGPPMAGRNGILFGNSGERLPGFSCCHSRLPSAGESVFKVLDSGFRRNDGLKWRMGLPFPPAFDGRECI